MILSVRYGFLAAKDFDQIYETFQQAFADYHLDMSYMTRERTWLRNIKSGVHYDCSVGAYDGNKMVGFTFVGLDEWKGKQAAFDAGTGIVPEFRGQGIARGMFEYVLPKLHGKGISTFLLEVLQPNKAAIKAYTKTGFKVTREFACYDLVPALLNADKIPDCPFQVKTIDQDTVRTFKYAVDWQPSWENSFSGMDRIRDTLIRLGAFDGDQCIGILVYYPLLSWIMSLVVRKEFRRQGAASCLMKSLMANLPDGIEKLGINNVDRSDKGMMAFFMEAGCRWVVDQYEMEYKF